MSDNPAGAEDLERLVLRMKLAFYTSTPENRVAAVNAAEADVLAAIRALTRNGEGK